MDQEEFALGDRVEVALPSASSSGTVLFKGELAGMQGLFFGVALDLPVGKNDGTLKGVRYFDAQNNHGLFVKHGAKNVGMKRIATAQDDSLLVAAPSLNTANESADDLIGGWGEANPFEKSLPAADLPSIAEWGSPISNSFQQDASPMNVAGGMQIDEWDPNGPMATPIKKSEKLTDESLVHVPLCESRDVSMVAPALHHDHAVEPPLPEALFTNISVADDPFASVDNSFAETPSKAASVEETSVKESATVFPESSAPSASALFGDSEANDPFSFVNAAEVAEQVVEKADSDAVVPAVHEAPAKTESPGAPAISGPTDGDDPFAGGSPQDNSDALSSLFGAGSNVDPFAEKTPAPVVDQVLSEASVLFGAAQPVDDPFASVSPGAVESVLQEAASLFKEELPQAPSLFGGSEEFAVEKPASLVEASSLFGKVDESASIFAPEKKPEKTPDASDGISEIPDLFGSVQDNFFAAPAPKPVTKPAAGISGYGAPVVKQAVASLPLKQVPSHALPAPIPSSPVKQQAPVVKQGGVAAPVPLPVLPKPSIVPVAQTPVLVSPVLSKAPAPPTSPAVFKAPVPIPVPVPVSVAAVPSSKVGVAPTQPVKTILPGATFVAPVTTVPVPAVKVAVPTFHAAQQPVRSVPTAVAPAPYVPPPIVKQVAAPPPPLKASSIHPAVASAHAPVPAAISAVAPPAFVPPSSFAPPAAASRVAPPTFQQAPRFVAPVPSVQQPPPRAFANVPPPSPQSSAVMAMVDDLGGDPFDEQFIPVQATQQQHHQQHQHQLPPAVAVARSAQVSVPSFQQPDAFFPASYGQSAPSTPIRGATATTYVPSPTGHFSSLQGSASPLDDTRPPVPIWSWGFGGRCAVMFPRHRRALSSLGVPSMAGEPLVPGPVRLVPVGKTVGAKSADLALAISFPGPLRAKASKSQVLAWLRSRISFLTQVYQVDPRADVGDELTLWEVLSVVCEHDGDVRSTGAAGGLSAGQTALIAALKGGKQIEPLLVDSQIPPDFSRLVVVETLLGEGKHSEAIAEAVRAKLWSHALYLASFSQDAEAFSSVRAQFASEACAPGSALRSLYLMLSGQMPLLFAQAADSSSVSLDKWRESAAMLLANGSQASSAAALGTLGDGLWSRQGRVFAAHVCYVLAQAPFLPVSDSNARLVLVGGDHKRRPNGFVSAESVQRSEVLEYCKALGNSQYSCPELEKYKLSYACYLAELGEIDKSFSYVTAIEEAVRNNPSAFRSDQSFLYGLKEFEERLVGFRPSLRSAGSKSLVRSLFGGVFRAVVGSDSPPPPVVPVANVNPQRPAVVNVPPAAVIQAAPVAPVKPAVVARPKEEPKQQNEGDQESEGGGWGFWPFGKKKAKEVKLGNQLERYYNEELKTWVRPGEEDKVRATISAPPPSDMLLRGAAPAVQPQTHQQQVQQAPPPMQQFQQAPPPIQQFQHVPPAMQQFQSPVQQVSQPQVVLQPQQQFVAASQPASVAPAASAPPNFSRAAAGGGGRRRYVDTLNTGAAVQRPAAAVSMPSLPHAFGGPTPPAFKMFVPAPVPVAQAPPEEQQQQQQQQQQPPIEHSAPPPSEDVAPPPSQVAPPVEVPRSESAPVLQSAPEEDFL